MKEISTNKGIFYFVEVPDDAYDFSNKLHSAQIEYTTNLPYKDGYIKINNAVILENYYNNKFEIISTTKDITEEQAEGIVEHRDIEEDENISDWIGYRNYLIQTKFDNFGEYKVFETAKESLQSLIQANGLSLEKNYLILKKN